MRARGYGSIAAVVCALMAGRAQAQGMTGGGPSMAPGPGAAAGSPVQAPGVTPLPPSPITPDDQLYPAPPPGTPRNPVTAETLEKAPKPRLFGDRGELVLSDVLSASVGVLGYTQSDAGSTHFGVDPAFDYFIAEDTSIGASAFVHYVLGKDASNVESRGLAGGGFVRVGRNIRVKDWLSVRPLVAAGIWYQSTKVETPALPFSGTGTVESRVKETVVTVDLFVPLLFHPAPHFFIGFGPDVFFDPHHSIDDGVSTSDHLRYSFGASSIIGGWL